MIMTMITTMITTTTSRIRSESGVHVRVRTMTRVAHSMTVDSFSTLRMNAPHDTTGAALNGECADLLG
jgi:hypothetical protein